MVFQDDTEYICLEENGECVHKVLNMSVSGQGLITKMDKLLIVQGRIN